jgi:hypothetical protein
MAKKKAAKKKAGRKVLDLPLKTVKGGDAGSVKGGYAAKEHYNR